MAGTFTNIAIHFVFSTKNRSSWIDERIRERLHDYMGGIVRELKGRQIAVNSVADHVHLYVYVPKTVSISEFMGKVKGSSSKWISATFPGFEDFSWQEGYGAFSVSKSNEKKVIEYIQRQQAHHHKKGFQEEFVEFLKANEISYDEKYVWK